MPSYKIRQVFLLFILSISLSSYAQFYDAGQEPSKLKWEQIKTKHFKIIFSNDFTTKAYELASILEKYSYYNSLSLKAKTPAIPAVLHNRMAISNAFVGWAPRRTEFYTIPPQDSYSQDWLEQLALHEGRHILQFSKMKQGFSKALYYIFGEQMIAGVLGVFVPMWFIEGDAVCMETALSNSGRGRLPSFEMPLRTQILGKKIYSYDKAVFGSYRNFIPNRYILGYHIVAESRKQYGYELWDNTLNTVAKYPFIVMPFAAGIHKKTGMGKARLYKSCMDSLKNNWVTNANTISYSSYILFNNNKHKRYSDYSRAYYINNNEIICEKWGIDNLEKIILCNKNGKEKTILTFGMKDRYNLSFSQNKMVWAEYTTDIRWENRTYSVIKLYDLNKKQSIQITNKSYYYSPSLSKDATKIAAIEITPSSTYSLVIFNSNGEKIKSIASEYFITQAVWTALDTSIVCIILTDSGKCLATIDYIRNKITPISDRSFSDISNPYVYNDRIFFCGAFSGIDNIYQLNVNDRKIHQLTSSRYGANFPSISNNGTTLLYSDYTPDGYRIVEACIDSLKKIAIESTKDMSIKIYEALSLEEKLLQANKPIGNYIDTNNYTIKPYSKWKHLFNIHSWGPIAVSADNSKANLGLTISSQNVLSTMFISGGYEYLLNQKTGNYYINATYKGIYPVIDVFFDWGKRSDKYSNEPSKLYYWQQTQAGISISLPLHSFKGIYNKGISPQISASLIQYNHIAETPTNFIKGNIYSLNYGLTLYYLMKSTQRNLAPRFGQVLKANYSHTPLKGINLGYQASANLLNYFPGILINHSILCALYGQIKNKGDYYYSDKIEIARGYRDISFDANAFSIKTTYSLPLLYPDLNIWFITYIKRITLAGFFDFTEGFNNDNREIYRSAGGELLFDAHFFRFYAPLKIGIRSSYLLEQKKIKNEFVFSVNLSAL